MKKKSISILLLGIVASLCWAVECDKDRPPQLPEESQNGRGSFGCVINGEVVVHYRSIRDHRWPEGEYNVSNGVFGFSVITRPTEYFVTLFVTRPRFGAGTYTVDSVVFYPTDSLIPHYYMAKNTAQITFTRMDEEFSPAIASGRFEFDLNAYEKETHQRIPNKKAEIRQGRFDFRHYACDCGSNPERVIRHCEWPYC
jgi:hypothetical protein